jgi:elongation factor P--(R)-beta-lysine ligase
MKTWQELSTDPALRQRFEQRAEILRAMREFFWEQKFLEVETPQLVPQPSMEPYLEVFETTLLDERSNQYRGFLTSSPEFAMKKLLSGGYENIFQICKSFRNQEGWSERHNPEFTILEWYRTRQDYTAIMQDCEDLFRFIGEKVFGTTKITFRGQEFDLSQPWERISVAEAFAKYTDIDLETMLSPEKLAAVAQDKGYTVTNETTWEENFNQIFLNEIEFHLGSNGVPSILYDYPAEMAALSIKKEADPRLAERFEFYCAGLEMGNAFSELTDWQEQLTRLQADRAEKERLVRTLFDIDPDFIAALQQGVPECAGIAVGVDRVCMFFLNAETIQDVLFFPATQLWTPIT